MKPIKTTSATSSHFQAKLLRSTENAHYTLHDYGSKSVVATKILKGVIMLRTAYMLLVCTAKNTWNN